MMMIQHPHFIILWLHIIVEYWRRMAFMPVMVLAAGDWFNCSFPPSGWLATAFRVLTARHWRERAATSRTATIVAIINHHRNQVVEPQVTLLITDNICSQSDSHYIRTRPRPRPPSLPAIIQPSRPSSSRLFFIEDKWSDDDEEVTRAGWPVVGRRFH